MNDDAQQKILALFQSYQQRLPAKIAAIEQQWQTLQRSPWQAEPWEDFHRQVHSLCGSTGLYGFIELSQALRILEVKLKTYQHQAPNVDELAEIPSLLQYIKLTSQLPVKLPESLQTVMKKLSG
jgi:HPt (histidine-containing phosphotransfer) domain-containing protein